MRDTMK